MDKLFSGRRILVVEDEVLLSMTIEDLLADLGCESVTVAGTTANALAVVEGQAFDVAVLDMNLNGKSSRPVADALAARGVPFLVATGNTADHHKGFSDRIVLQKPFKYSELVDGLAGLLPR